MSATTAALQQPQSHPRCAACRPSREGRSRAVAVDVGKRRCRAAAGQGGAGTPPQVGARGPHYKEGETAAAHTAIHVRERRRPSTSQIWGGSDGGGHPRRRSGEGRGRAIAAEGEVGLGSYRTRMARRGWCSRLRLQRRRPSAPRWGRSPLKAPPGGLRRPALEDAPPPAPAIHCRRRRSAGWMVAAERRDAAGPSSLTPMPAPKGGDSG